MRRAEGHIPGADDKQRRRRLLALLSDGDISDGGTSSAAPAGATDGPRERLGRVCAFSVSEAHVSGAGITVMAGIADGLAGARDQVCATGARTRGLEDLQLTTGQGPCLDAYGSGTAVLVGELATETARWPGYGPEALDHGTAAVFSLPLQVGAVRLGTLDLNRDTPGALSSTEFADALVLAGLATETLLELSSDSEAAMSAPGEPTGAAPAVDGTVADGDNPGAAEENLGWLPDVHAEVHQASGMVSVHAGVGVGEALLRIRAYAFTHGEPIADVARRIIAGDLALEHDDDS